MIARVIYLHSGSVSAANHSLHVPHSACDGLVLRGFEKIHSTSYVLLACVFEVCWEGDAADGLLVDASCEANALVHLHTTQNVRFCRLSTLIERVDNLYEQVRWFTTSQCNTASLEKSKQGPHLGIHDSENLRCTVLNKADSRRRKLGELALCYLQSVVNKAGKRCAHAYCLIQPVCDADGLD